MTRIDWMEEKEKNGNNRYWNNIQMWTWMIMIIISLDEGENNEELEKCLMEGINCPF